MTYRSTKATVVRVCANCGVEYSTRRCQRRKYCSILCFRAKKVREEWEIEAIKKGWAKVIWTPERRKAQLANVMISAEMRRGKPRDTGAVEKTAAALKGRPQTAPGLIRGETNRKAIPFHIRDPQGRSYHGRNLLEFVRTHEWLFQEDDLVWVPVKKGKMAVTCRAYKGLSSLFRRSATPGAWKGWTIVSTVETFHNAGEDLLDRRGVGSLGT